MHGTVHPAFSHVARAFERLLPADGHGGAALAVMHEGELVVDVAGGSRDDEGTPFTTDTLALSFSTTKGIASTLLHLLVTQGKLSYDARVSRYWPEFAANGKEAITVRQVLCHEAGLHSIRAVTNDANDMLDWDGMLRRIEAAAPQWKPGTANAYHGLTYGYLAGGLIERASGRRFTDVLRDELATPLALSGCYVGLPDEAMSRRAKLVTRRPATDEPNRGRSDSRTEVIAKRSNDPLSRRRVAERLVRLAGFDPAYAAESLMPRGISRFDWNDEAVVRATIPSAGGMFDARSLARVYGMLANGGELDGVRLLGTADVTRIGAVQNRRIDRVLPIPMHWRLGYHRVLNVGAYMPNAFGHFGYGGSGAFCDPSRRISVGFVLNHGVGTPFGDSRMWTIAGAVARASDVRRLRRVFS